MNNLMMRINLAWRVLCGKGVVYRARFDIEGAVNVSPGVWMRDCEVNGNGQHTMLIKGY